MPTPTPKVFISYSHDSDDHAHRVRVLANRLRGEGVDCILDQYETAPPKGWRAWMEEQLDRADFVLVVSTETYLQRATTGERPGVGRGVRFESVLIGQDLYEVGMQNKKYIPVLFEGSRPEHIIKSLRPFAYYWLQSETDYDNLYRHLTGQPRIVKPDLGDLRQLPPESGRDRDLFRRVAEPIIHSIDRSTVQPRSKPSSHVKEPPRLSLPSSTQSAFAIPTLTEPYTTVRDVVRAALTLADKVSVAEVGGMSDLNAEVSTCLQQYENRRLAAAICHAAVSLILTQSDRQEGQLSTAGVVALLKAWLSIQEPDRNIISGEFEERFLAWLPSSPTIYSALAEEVACEDPPNPWLERLLLRGFIDHFETPAVNTELRRAFDHWLGFIHPAGSAMRGTSDDDDRIGKDRERLQERLGQSLVPGELEFAGYGFTVVEHAGAKGCVAEAVMDYTNKYPLFAWVIRSAPDPIWGEVEAEARRLIDHGHLVTKQAAYRLLSFHGSEQAAELRKSYFDDPRDLFPLPPDLAQFNDPCLHRPWNRLGDLEGCMERTDINTMVLARKLKPWYAEPELEIPAVFIDRLAEEIDKISPEAVWKDLWRDHNLDTLEDALSAADPEIFAQLIRLVAADQNRQGEALWRWALELTEHSLLLGEKEQRIVYHTWKRLSQEHELEPQERDAEAFLFILVLSWLNASEQIAHILQRPEDPQHDLTRFEPSFSPLTSAAEIETLLSNADATTIRAARVLWFLSIHSRSLAPSVVEKAARFLFHEESVVRFDVLCLLHNSNHLSAVSHLERANWRFRPENGEQENH